MLVPFPETQLREKVVEKYIEVPVEKIVQRIIEVPVYKGRFCFLAASCGLTGTSIGTHI